MTLREKAERAEMAIQQALGTNGESDHIVQIVERVAREAYAEALDFAAKIAEDVANSDDTASLIAGAAGMACDEIAHRIRAQLVDE